MTEPSPPPAAGQIVPPLEVLQAIRPFAREEHRRGFRFHVNLSRQMDSLIYRHPRAALIPDVPLRVNLYLQLEGAMFGLARLTEAFARVRKIDDHAAHAGYLRALTYLGAHDEALDAVRDYAERHPHESAIQLILADQLMMAGMPDHALGTYRSIRAAFPEGDIAHAFATRALLEAGLLTDDSPLAPSGDEPPTRILCLNLDRDWRRRRVIERMLRGAGALEFLSGVVGSSLPEQVAASLVSAAKGPVRPGELGCALSHWRAWDICAATLDEGAYALICEDDCRFIHGPGVGLAQTVAAARAAGAEVVFVNERACRLAEPPAEGAQAVVALDDPALVARMRADRLGPGWGLDGYLVSRAGAARLRAAWAEVGILGAADWQAFLMSFAALEPWQRGPARARLAAALLERGNWPKLSCHVAARALTCQRDLGISVINTDSR